MNFDLDSLGLAPGTYDISAKSRADGHEDSDFSNVVPYTASPPAGKVLTVYYKGAKIVDSAPMGDNDVELYCDDVLIQTIVGNGIAKLKCLGKPSYRNIVIGKQKLKCGGKKLDGDIVAVVSGYAPVPQLDTPINVLADGTVVSCDPVENATRYRVLADGVSIGVFDTATLLIDSNGNLLTDSDGNYLEIMEV